MPESRPPPISELGLSYVTVKSGHSDYS